MSLGKSRNSMSSLSVMPQVGCFFFGFWPYVIGSSITIRGLNTVCDEAQQRADPKQGGEAANHLHQEFDPLWCLLGTCQNVGSITLKTTLGLGRGETGFRGFQRGEQLMQLWDMLVLVAQ